MKKKIALLLLLAVICLASCENGMKTTSCEGCGIGLTKEEGTKTVLGMWLCKDCVGKGMGGTTPKPFDLPEE